MAELERDPEVLAWRLVQAQMAGDGRAAFLDTLTPYFEANEWRVVINTIGFMSCQIAAGIRIGSTNFEDAMDAINRQLAASKLRGGDE